MIDRCINRPRCLVAGDTRERKKRNDWNKDSVELVCGLYYSQAEIPHFSRESETAADVEDNTKTFHIMVLSNVKRLSQQTSESSPWRSVSEPVATVRRFHTVHNVTSN